MTVFGGLWARVDHAAAGVEHKAFRDRDGLDQFVDCFDVALGLRLIDHARIGMTFYQPQNNEMAENLTIASDQHDAIIAAIEARNAEEAGRLADEHWRLSRDQIEMFVMPTALDLALGTFPQSSA